MRAKDIMTRDVVTVPPETPLSALAQLLSDRGISAVPVVEPDGQLAGIVTEADLIRRLAAVLQPKGGWLSGMLFRSSAMADDYARLHGRTAGDMMTTKLVTAQEGNTVEQAAKLMEEHHIKRLPVLRDGRLVGVISRADLLRAVLVPPETLQADAPDARIREAVMVAMREQPWADTLFTWPEVREGVVTFYGFCRSPEVQRGLRLLAEGLPGVKRVVIKTEEPPVIPFGMG